jgi:crotonobetainyl-CoA:carnitine CoA-transferase CaiB-like acyl-CoA transferase
MEYRNTQQTTSADAQPALEHLRVVDLSRVVAGPWCTQTLADLGADVIKIERPRTGDDSRAWGPPFMRDQQGNVLEESVSFAAFNRGKRSIELDLADPLEAAQLRELAARADVFVENYKTGSLEKYGLDYTSLAAINPRIIYCSITGFGLTGPYRERPGYDTIMQGMCGLMSLTGRPDEMLGGGPVKAGLPIVDLMTGLYAAVGILAALHCRTVTGRGQHIDLALLDVGISSLAHLGLQFLSGNGSPRRHGNRLPMVSPSDAFTCRNGHVMLIVGNDQQFRRLCRVLEIPELADDERYSTNSQRLANSETLHARLNTAFALLDVNDCVERCSGVNVPCGPINDVSQVFQDSHVHARQMVRWIPRAGHGRVPVIASPIRFSESPTVYRAAPPVLGHDTMAVLGHLAASEDWPPIP